MSFIALLDANVLYPIALCDTLLRCVEANLYQLAWSDDILAEVERALKRERPDLRPEKIERRVQWMRQQFDSALVTGYESLIPVMKNHEGDRHVLAAAVMIRAGVIVTSNKRHFSQEVCDTYGIAVQDPDEFLLDLWDLAPETMFDILQLQAGDLRNPPRTLEDVLDHLEIFAPDFVTLVRRSKLSLV